MSRICVYTHCPLELIRSRVYLRVMGSHLCSQTTEMDFGSPNVYSVYQGHYAHKVTNSPSWTRPLYTISCMHSQPLMIYPLYAPQYCVDFFKPSPLWAVSEENPLTVQCVNLTLWVYDGDTSMRE